MAVELGNKRKVIIIGIALIAAVLLAIFGFGERTTNQPFLDLLRLQTPEVKEIKLTEEAPEYKLTVSYPEFHNLGDPAREASANAAIKGKVQTAIEDFKRSAGEEAGTLPSAKSEIQIRHEVIYLNSSIASIKFSEDTYIEGAAHPLVTIWPFNYNFRDNKELTLADIFDQGTNYLSVLSQLSRDSLKNQLQEYYLQESAEPGTEPRPDNFKIFLLTKDKLIIIFNVYQVADYALGPQSVEIPYDRLSVILNQQWLELIRK